MSEAFMAGDTAATVMQNLYFSDDRDKKMEKTRRKIQEESKELQRQRRSLELEREEFSRNKALEEKRLEYEKNLFDTKWKMLEEEWRKLAMEQEQLKLKRQFYARVEEFDKKKPVRNEVGVSEFFSGVNTASSLKKRYKDLIKIFHPDNLSGDTVVIQKINREYQELKKQMAV